MILLVIILVIAGLLLSPVAPYARTWGYYPSGGVALLIVIVLLLWLTGRLGGGHSW